MIFTNGLSASSTLRKTWAKDRLQGIFSVFFALQALKQSLDHSQSIRVVPSTG
jgi:hypothetical protein